MTIRQRRWKSSVLWSVHHGTLNRTCSRFTYFPKFNFYLYEHRKLKHNQNFSYTILTFHLELTNKWLWNEMTSKDLTKKQWTTEFPKNCQCFLVYFFHCYLILESIQEDVRRERGSNLWHDGKLKTCIEQS